jgi:ATP-dependent helicase/nuclease subunit A
LWPDRTEQALPYFCPTSQQQAASVLSAQNKLKQLAEEEYQRLLYVALTRAESRLYIGGYLTKQKPMESNWYNMCLNAMNNHPDIEKDGDIMRLFNPMTGDPDKKQKQSVNDNQNIDSPDWLFKPMPPEPTPPRPLVPSRPSGDNMPVLSPLKSDNQKRFLRGNVTHKLLQLLPDIAPDKREAAAKRYLAMPVHDLPKSMQQSIIEETLAILNHTDFAPIFGEGSLAEASITGLMNGNQLVSGQIDRLLITDDEILIIDYKTNRPPPKNPEDIPPLYQNQMRSYRDVMQEIYPNHTIKTALIWTDGPSLMIVD